MLGRSSLVAWFAFSLLVSSAARAEETPASTAPPASGPKTLGAELRVRF